MYLAVVLEVLRQVDRGHAALAELALDGVAIRERGGESGDRVDWIYHRQASDSV